MPVEFCLSTQMALKFAKGVSMILDSALTLEPWPYDRWPAAYFDVQYPKESDSLYLTKTRKCPINDYQRWYFLFHETQTSPYHLLVITWHSARGLEL